MLFISESIYIYSFAHLFVFFGVSSNNYGTEHHQTLSLCLSVAGTSKMVDLHAMKILMINSFDNYAADRHCYHNPQSLQGCHR